MGSGGFEPPTSRLSGVRSNHLSYEPFSSFKNGQLYLFLLRKDVIQPHLPVQLPCYDLTPLTESTFGIFSLAVRPMTSGILNSGGLTGGVYKARERIHRGIADPRLLAIPTSCRRVSACNLY